MAGGRWPVAGGVVGGGVTGRCAVGGGVTGGGAGVRPSVRGASTGRRGGAAGGLRRIVTALVGREAGAGRNPDEVSQRAAVLLGGTQDLLGAEALNCGVRDAG
ncbi:hypothetical protein GFH48_14055 [Streptomyces fagopyri]|uniref:Uncharacterized protein n=1 Tax=Streptomyces fagopyri TaxID=2662397 RepID=A0A5Q0LB34_9ACTN|nr:hypothetical protein [Streptomyces fagopyri]QFZ74233.1 hypothetical protein GFH48_14055 [Streptomyces fagopyri]